MSTHTWTRILDLVIPGRGPTFGASEDVGRVFMVCRRPGCGRTVPYWRLVVAKRTAHTRINCQCGGGDFSPMHIPEWKAMWWVLVRGKLIRGVILRHKEWDPRMPWQRGEHAA